MFLQNKIAHLNKMQYKNYICSPGGASLPKAELENKPSVKPWCAHRPQPTWDSGLQAPIRQEAVS